MKFGFLRSLIAIILLTNYIGLYAQLAPKDQAEIRKKAQKLLSEYEEKLNQVGKEVRSIDKTRINVEAFLKLFVDRKTQVFNDLDPAHLLSEYYEAETYSSNIALWYPAGIAISLDFKNAQVSNIISHGEGVYSIDFIIDKKINGIYLGKTLNTNIENLMFRVAFTGIGLQYENFKIAGIRKPSKKNIELTDTKILEVRSFPLSEDARRDIDRETRTLLNDYTNYLSLIGDTVEDIEEKILYKGSFRSLFTNNQSPVFNDILPEGMKNQFVPVSDYINLYSEAYSSEGGKVTFDTDSADLGFITKRNDSTFIRNVQVTKYFEGNYLGKRLVKYQIRLKLLIVFYFKNGVYKNFQINRIDQVIQKKAEAAETRIFTDLNKRKKTETSAIPAKTTTKPVDVTLPTPVDKSKIRLSVGAMAGIGSINDKNLSNLTLEENAHKWEIKPQLCYSAFVHYTYKLSPGVGLFTGIGYSKLSTNYTLNSFKGGSDTAFMDQSDFLDTAHISFRKYISAKMDSDVAINFINIPIGLLIEFNTSHKIHFFIKPGINIAIVNNAISNTKSYIHYYGFYGENEKFDIFKYKDWPQFNFYTIDNGNTKNTRDIKSSFNTISFSAFANIGVIIPLSSHLAISLSGDAQYGLTNLVKNNGVYKDIFGQTEAKNIALSKKHVFEFQPVNIFTYGFTIEFIVKL